MAALSTAEQRPDAATPLSDLGMIGDRRTAALVTRRGNIVWYCPGRFDAPSLLAALLDDEAGFWRIEVDGLKSAGREYVSDSAVLRTSLQTRGGLFQVTDWLNAGPDAPAGMLCRMFGPASVPLRIVLSPRPDYGRRPPKLRAKDGMVAINGVQQVFASHPLQVQDDQVVLDLPQGEKGWMVLSDGSHEPPGNAETVERWLAASLRHWGDVNSHITYHGPYEAAVASSLRALRMLTHEETGGIIAAATTSLPEVPGGSRNYDYRYAWLRDSAMIVSALVRAGSDGPDERRFLSFICWTCGTVDGTPLPPFATLDGRPSAPPESLPLTGYLGSQPVQTGNVATDQLQLDGLGNVLLAAKLVYANDDCRDHWETVREVADFLAEHWDEPDYGIWEEEERRHYTSSKVIAACGLRFIADYADDEEQARRWREASEKIRLFVEKECRTSDGAYGAWAGGEEVDISAALFPVWDYTAADTPEMIATIDRLEREHMPRAGLFRRTLVQFDAAEEGAFLAGSFWVSQYWTMRGEFEKARDVLEAGLACANDLGLFSEEADPSTGRLLGNMPQSFVHAAFIGAVLDLKTALEEDGGKVTGGAAFPD